MDSAKHQDVRQDVHRDIKEHNSAVLREDIAARRTTFRALPEIISLYTTDICNLRCVMCPRNLAPGTQKLQREVLGRVCDDMFPTARKAILTAAAGEPLIADFDLVLDAALRHGVAIDVITNGTFLTPALYEKARPAFDHLNVSLDSSDPGIYEHIRLGSRFQRVHDNLSAICEQRRRQPDGVLLSLSAVVMCSNLPGLSDLVRYAARLGVDGVLCQRLRHEVKPTREEDPYLVWGPAEVERHLDTARAAAREVGVNLFLAELGAESVVVCPPRAKRPPALEGQGICWFGAQNFGVMHTGDVYPCCFPTDHRLGNVRDTAPREIWNGPVARRLRAAHFASRGTAFCSGCIHAPHLRAWRAEGLQRRVQRARMVVAHVAGRWRERRRDTSIASATSPGSTTPGGAAPRAR